MVILGIKHCVLKAKKEIKDIPIYFINNYIYAPQSSSALVKRNTENTDKLSMNFTKLS